MTNVFANLTGTGQFHSQGQPLMGHAEMDSRKVAKTQRKKHFLCVFVTLRESILRSSLVLAVLFGGQLAGFAADEYLLELVHPQVGQVGTTVEVMVEGAFLQHPEEVLFYQPGIRCTKFESMDTVLSIDNGQRRETEAGRAAKLTFEISKQARPGEYQLRIRTRDGLSELVTFWVTTLPVVMEEYAWIDTDGARNDSAESAQQLPRSCTVVGYIPGRLPQDHDWYAVDCRKGERLSVEVVAARLGTLHYGGMNDPAVRIFDSEGKELGRNDDNALHTQDPVLTVMIPRDGRYFIDMHQQMDYEAARLRHYLMHVGTFARPMVTFPLGGQAGRTIPVSLIGDASGDVRMNVTLPTSPGSFEDSFLSVRHPEAGPTAWPNELHIASFPDAFESADHNSPESAQPIADLLPVAINGRVTGEGEVDWYRIRAKKGERYRVVGYGKTLDSELDPRIWIHPAPGNSSNRNYEEDDSSWPAHDLVGHSYRHQTKRRLDPVFMFEPDSDGEWLVGAGDTRREFGPQHIYRIEFQPHVDSAFVYFAAYPSTPTIVRDRIALFPGHSYCRPVSIQPGFGSTYAKPLQLRAKNLPAGVTMESSPFKQSDGIIPVLFRAEKGTTIGAALVDLIVEPVDPNDRPHFRGGFIQNNQATNRRGDYAMCFDKTRKMALAVVDGAAFNLEVERPSIPLVRNGELSLKVKVQRHPSFEEAVYCEMDWLPTGVNKQPPLIIPAGKTEGTYKLSAAGSATPGEFQISITGRENKGGNVRTAAGFHFVCSPFVPLSVGEPYVTVNLVRSAIERGTVGEIVGEISHHRTFSGEAVLQLGRLPFGVEQVLPYPTIKPGEVNATFKVKVTKDCLVGQYKDIFCGVAVTDGGQQIIQQTGNGTLRVDIERNVSE